MTDRDLRVLFADDFSGGLNPNVWTMETPIGPGGRVTAGGQQIDPAPVAQLPNLLHPPGEELRPLLDHGQWKARMSLRSEKGHLVCDPLVLLEQRHLFVKPGLGYPD